MVEKVNCLYRHSEKCAVFSGTFDLQKGIIDEFPELVHLQLNNWYEYFDENYQSSMLLPREYLYRIMYKFPEALMVVDYNSIGVAIVTREFTQLFIIATNNYVEKHQNLVGTFRLEFRKVGIHKSKVETLHVMQPISFVSATSKNGQDYVVCKGKYYKVKGTLDDYNPKCKELYSDLVLTPNEYYGIGVSNGVPCFIQLDEFNREAIILTK